MIKNVIVVKSLKKTYGYSLKWVGANPPSWIMGANYTFGWYRYKRDANKRAQDYNK